MMEKIIVVLASAFILFSVCMIAIGSPQKTLKADTPINAAQLIKTGISLGNYDAFKMLFSEDRQNSISPQQFEDMEKLNTPGADLKNYELITFSNGKMLLVNLTPEPVNGEYKIQDIIEVPDNMRSLFQITDKK